MLNGLNDVKVVQFYSWRGFSDEVEQDSNGAFISIEVEKDKSSFLNACGGLSQKSVRPWVHRRWLCSFPTDAVKNWLQGWGEAGGCRKRFLLADVLLCHLWGHQLSLPPNNYPNTSFCGGLCTSRQILRNLICLLMQFSSWKWGDPAPCNQAVLHGQQASAPQSTGLELLN